MEKCPECGGNTETYRHPFAEVWCVDCGFVLRKEGEGAPAGWGEALFTKPPKTITGMEEYFTAWKEVCSSLESLGAVVQNEFSEEVTSVDIQKYKADFMASVFRAKDKLNTVYCDIVGFLKEEEERRSGK